VDLQIHRAARDEAQKRFETFERDEPNQIGERMASLCFAERGGCLLHLGRLDQAAAVYEDSIRHAERVGDPKQAAVGKFQLGTVRMMQEYDEEALTAFEEAREVYTRLDEPEPVATCLHQIGMVYGNAGHPEAAEDAYRKSLAIRVRLGNVAGQASTLMQLGILYGEVLARLEEAVTFYRQAADKFVEIQDVTGEGRTRNNLAAALRRLGRFDEARQEILRAIECRAHLGRATRPWTSWSVLASIETDAGNITAAAEAKGRATASYLAYRRGGGENHDVRGRICLDITQSLLQGLASSPELSAWIRPFIQVLQAIVSGGRDRTLADTPGLDYTMAAEILFLLETLEKAQ
jgi:tetratricopeptide (TPR) repeat protein